MSHGGTTETSLPPPGLAFLPRSSPSFHPALPSCCSLTLWPLPGEVAGICECAREHRHRVCVGGGAGGAREGRVRAWREVALGAGAMCGRSKQLLRV